MRYSFGEMMQEWLYGQNGYYHRARIGEDFYTAVNVSRLFGGALAKHIIALLESSQLTLPLHIVEIGAHHGELMCDVYDFLEALSIGVMQHTRFSIIEPLESLRMAARGNISKREVLCVESFSNISLKHSESVFIFSNELFDAFACEIVRERCVGQGRVVEMLCGYVQNLADRESLRLEWCDMASMGDLAHRAGEVRDFMGRYGLRNGEIPLAWEGFVRDLCDFVMGVKSWRFLSFDYAPLGTSGLSLRGFRSHNVLDFTEIMRDISGLFGEIDLTYNVDFTLLEQIFASNGVRKVFQSRLNALLVEFGIMELLQNLLETNPRAYKDQSLRVRQLLGGGLGEKFMGVCFGSL